MDQTATMVRNYRHESATLEERFIRLREVLSISGKSRSSLYEAIKKGKFPAPVKLQGRSSAWVRSEVQQWIQVCIAASRESSSASKSTSSKNVHQASTVGFHTD